MKLREITKDVSYVGAVDWDRRLFDSLIPLPDGTSYNSYLIRGSEKTVLLDTVDPAMTDVLFSQLEGVATIDYVIAHHAEQDHSGSIPDVLDKYKSAKVVCTPKAKGMLIDLLSVPDDRFVTVGDGETLSLGNKVLEFVHTPWVHWPETMGTYLREDRIFFSCDFFGSHLAASNLFVTDEGRVYEAAKRYYAEIMMPFRNSIKAYVTMVKTLPLDLVAPSHGPLYRRPQFILDAYEDWVSDTVKNEVVIVYVSMHGSTQKMVEHLTDALITRGICVKPFNLTRTDIGELAMALVDTATVVIATPTVLFGPHPQVVYATYLANLLKPKIRFASVIGSFGWGGKSVETIVKMLDHLKAEFIEPVMVKGLPDETTLRELERLADDILKKHSDSKII